jgi:predicted DCC family thiol-disulfide oxidoreductase YuxK
MARPSSCGARDVAAHTDGLVSAAASVPANAVRAVETTAPILFFDGECGFCDRAIRFSMSHDTHGRLYAATLEGETARTALAPFRSMLVGIDSTVLYLPATPDRQASVQFHTDASLTVLRLLGGGWAVLGMAGQLVPRWIRDNAYKAFAKRRFRFFGRVDACQLWPPEWRARMLP